MHPFSYTGLRLIHDEKIRNAMAQARFDAELVRESRRNGWLLLPGSILRRIYKRSSILTNPHSRAL